MFGFRDKNGRAKQHSKHPREKFTKFILKKINLFLNNIRWNENNSILL
jgi:hypothetical protein